MYRSLQTHVRPTLYAELSAQLRCCSTKRMCRHLQQPQIRIVQTEELGVTFHTSRMQLSWLNHTNGKPYISLHLEIDHLHLLEEHWHTDAPPPVQSAKTGTALSTHNPGSYFYSCRFPKQKGATRPTCSTTNWWKTEAAEAVRSPVRQIIPPRLRKHLCA